MALSHKKKQWYYCASVIQIVVIAITHTIVYIAHLISAAAIFVAQTIATLVMYVANLVITVVTVVFRFMAMIGVTIWSMLVSVSTAIATTTQHIFNALVYLIELPFKIIFAFWLRIKPYVDVFARHVEMTGSDLSNGFTSMGKVASLMGATK
jgi:hypothetical protein